MTVYQQMTEEELLAKIATLNELNNTLLVANTSYQIKMAGQEFEIYDLRAGKDVLQALQARDQDTIAEQKELVKKLTIRVIDLEEETARLEDLVTEYRGY